MLTKIDIGVVVFYGVLMGFIGYYAKRLVHNSNDYFAGGKRVPWWLAAISHHVSGYSAFAFVGLGTLAYGSGLSAWTFFAPPIVIAMIAGAFIWAPRWSRMQILTPVEYLETRYNNIIRQLFGWSGIGLKFIDEGVKLYSLAIIVHVATGWPLPQVIVVCGVVTIAYLFFGGLWATMLTDFAQFIIQFTITLLLVPMVLSRVGGMSGLYYQLPVDQRGLFSPEVSPSFLFVYLFVIILSYNGGTWGLAQRFYSIGKPRQARKAALLSASLYLFYPLAVFIPMWAAHSLIGPIDNPEQTYMLVAQKILPSIAPGLLGLLIASMFASTMSMIDTDINALSAVFTQDIYHRNFHRTASEKHLLRVGMCATVVLGALTIASALLTIHLQGAFKAMVEWFAAIMGPVSLPLLLGMVLRKPTWRGALLAWLSGFAAFIFFKYGWPLVTGLQSTFALYTGMELLISLVVFLAEGMIGKRSPEKERQVQEFFAQFEDFDS
ncbi:Na+:solute symporter [candidate division KSB1 bacterium]|nr:Na+:solute symporter [candidate division KSB1 bacterium]